MAEADQFIAEAEVRIAEQMTRLEEPAQAESHVDAEALIVSIRAGLDTLKRLRQSALDTIAKLQSST